MTELAIREATESDLKDVLAVERAAFGKEEEVTLVRDLLEDRSAKPGLSLLAFQNDKAVGHILFSKSSLDSNTSLRSCILAPLAVVPGLQKQGIGKQLIEHGLKALQESGMDLVFVLGYPDYYSRHGFESAGRLGFEAPYPILEKNADAWMVQALRPDLLGKCKGKVVCANALNKPEYWQE